MNGGVGFFGKLPSAGDFVQRRLPSAFVEGWDRDFQRAVETGRRELGAHWDAAWRQGAAWRFVLPAPVCGNVAWCGLIGPAVDRLGRAFPMVLAAPCGGDVATVLGNHAWFDALERVYRNAQHEVVSVETFDVRVAALPGPLTHVRPATAMAAFWRALPWDSGQWRLAMPEGAAVGMVLAEAWSQLGKRPGPWCLWWTERAACLLATRGLPSSYAALLEPVVSRVGDMGDMGDMGDALREFGSASARQWESVALQGAEEIAAGQSGLHAEDGHDDRVLPVGSSAAGHAADASDALLLLDDGRTLVLSADDGPSHSHQRAARAIRETAQRSAADLPSLRTGLLALHAQLRGARHDAHDAHDARYAAAANGAALVARFDAAQVRLLRIGAAAAWHWRRGQLQPLFVERAAGAGGEFDDLLFGDAWLAMPGIGASEEPDCDEACITLEDDDRLLLLVSRALIQLPQACLLEALALTTNEDARLHLAMCAGLGTQPAQWPLAVIEAGS
ncbi:type VI secretion system-associated protein TagF [Paraburkholderia sp. CI3]|uniref:type VI secretion system-associated protein TagF n=1 Tax=Paraburkholderia sp. CI3 TaxID=2991060 RepID=UPI003D1FF0CF